MDFWHLIVSRETYLARVVERKKREKEKNQPEEETAKVFICDPVPMSVCPHDHAVSQGLISRLAACSLLLSTRL